VGATVAAKELLFATSLPNPHNAAQPLAAIAMYSNQSGINASKYGTSDIFDLRWHQSIKTGTAGGGGIPEAPIDGEAYGRKNGAWTIVSGSAGMSEAPMDGLQYGRQSGSWTEVSGTGGVGATAYSALTDVRITGTMTNGNSPVWIAASGAWYPMPIWEDSKDPTGFIDNENIHMSYDVSTRKIYLSGTLSYYWHGIKRTLASGSNTWTSTPHDVADGLYYLYSSDGVNFAWSTVAWTFDLLQVAYAVKITSPSPVSYQFGIRECHGMMQWQVHEELHQTISAFRESGGAPIVGSYQLASADNAHTRPSFAAMDIHDEDVDSTIKMLTGTYSTFRVTSGTTNFQAGEDYPFRATGSYILINNPTTGAETVATNLRFLNVYQIALPVTNDADSQKYRMVFLQPQAEYTSATLAQEEDISHLSLGNFASQFVEAVFYTRLTYSTLAANTNIGKVKLDSITFVARFGAGVGAGGNDAVPATYVLSGTNYNMPASVGTALEYARADHLHGTPPSGTGGSSTTTVNNVFSDIRINQTSGTSVYPNLIGNQNTSNLYYTVSDRIYTSGKLLVFLNGQALSQGIDWSEQHPASGTFFFISGSAIPTSTDIITAQYTISGTLAVADAPMTGLNYNRNSGSWVSEIDYFSVEAQIGDTVNVVTSGTTGYLEVPVGANIESYRIMSGISGTISVDVMKSTYASAPPTVSICSGTYVTLTNDFKNENTNLNGWTKNIVAGDWVGFKVLTAPALVKQVTVSLNCRKS
jgi:hypothetical protein